MTKDGLTIEIDRLSQTYLSLGDDAATIVRKLRKIPNAGTRSKLIGELRNLDKKRLDLLDQIDDLTKSIQPVKSGT